MPDILPISMQDFMHGRKSNLRAKRAKEIIIRLKINLIARTYLGSSLDQVIFRYVAEPV